MDRFTKNRVERCNNEHFVIIIWVKKALVKTAVTLLVMTVVQMNFVRVNVESSTNWNTIENEMWRQFYRQNLANWKIIWTENYGVVMPQLDCFKLCKKTKYIDSHIKVCFITAFEVNYQSLRVLFPNATNTDDIGCFVRKPLDRKTLVNHVEAKLNYVLP